ncbi:MAG: endo-1,4-beta-xylanase [Bacteroidota bacterium]
MMRFSGMVALLCGLLMASSVHAQEDAYHTALRDLLRQDYGITGGTWVLSQDGKETDKVGRGGLTSVRRQQRTADGELFAAYDSFHVATAVPDRPWERTVRWSTRAAIADGDVLLLVMWVRGQALDGGTAEVQVRLEQAGPPYASHLHQTYGLGSDWQLVLVPFRNESTFNRGAARFQFNLGLVAQDVDLGGLALLNFGTAYAPEDLPRRAPAPDYAGSAENHPWRAEAAARIDQHRKGDLTVRVTDANGDVVPDASVAVEMQRHAFPFGSFDQSNRLAERSRIWAQYRDTFEEMFNSGVIGIYWRNWDQGNTSVMRSLEWMQARGMSVRAHPILWSDVRPGESWSSMPEDVRNSNDPAFLRQAIEARIVDVTNQLGDIVTDYDVLNEAAHLTKLEDVLGEDERAVWFQRTNELDADAKLFINDFSILSNGAGDEVTDHRYKEIIQDLLEDGAPLHGIGFQAHMGSNPTDPLTLLSKLDEYAQFGLELKVTEFDMSGMDEELAGRYIRDFYTAMYSHPSVTGVVMWGFHDDNHWLGDAPLFRADWSIKPAGEAYRKLLFETWWTDETGVTNADGQYATRGFQGEYAVTVEHGSLSKTVEAALSGDGLTLEVQLDGIATGREATTPQERFELQPAYPNPLRDRTTLTFSLPTAQRIQVQVFDVLGRAVATVAEGWHAVGEHTALWSAEAAAPGTYLVRLTATDGRTLTQPLVVLP